MIVSVPSVFFHSSFASSFTEKPLFQADVVMKCLELDLALINPFGVPQKKKKQKKKQVAPNIRPALPGSVLSLLAILYG